MDSAQKQLVLAAERLFARHGIDGVSLRQISSAAGNANNSAVQYHFGGKRQLVLAILEYRLGGLCARREELVAQLRPNTLRAWVECQLHSLIELADWPDSHYLGLISMVAQFGTGDMFEIPSGLRDRVEVFHQRLAVLMPHIAEPLRSHRIRQAQSFMVLAAAQRERARDTGWPVLPAAVAVAELIDAMVGFLEASTSTGTQAELERTTVDQKMFLPAFF
jgi:AcrR family transcriptional regulator